MRFKETEIGVIPKDWEVKQISDIGKVVGGGTPKTKIDEYWNGEISWITPKDLSGFNDRYIYEGERSITEEGLSNSSTKLLPKGTVLFSSRAPVGYVAIAGKEVATNQGFKSIICDEKVAYNLFVYYLMKFKNKDIEKIAGGSTFKEVSGKVVKEFKVQLPPLQEQKSIANILSTLDEKIETNNKINKRLEGMAQTIFKHWFVDFEFPNEDGKPYKSSGGKMIESELGLIPEGWEFKKISSLFSVKDGTHASPKTVNDGYPLITSRHLMGTKLDFKNAKCISQVDYDEVNRRSKVDRYDILISMIGTVGNIYLVQNEKIEFAIKNVGLFKSSEQVELYEYIYCYLKTPLIEQYIKDRMAGSTQQYISLGELRKIPVIMPNINDDNLIQDFKKIINPIFNHLYINSLEIEKITEIRNTLLSKLMSGEIRVPLNNKE